MMRKNTLEWCCRLWYCRENGRSFTSCCYKHSSVKMFVGFVFGMLISQRSSFVRHGLNFSVVPLELEEINNTATKVFCLPFRNTSLDCLKSMVNDSVLETKYFSRLHVLQVFGFCFFFRDGRGGPSKLVVCIMIREARYSSQPWCDV